ncbi:transmembrane ascorbate-dependent reductase CYB561 [Anabrus simplex]|uniref:transmembrane ascorbate-dependent reductase CYB561 n=1 Tax=Anabrus simplex TaxID=316456 RepID=UPI0035A35F9E
MVQGTVIKEFPGILIFRVACCYNRTVLKILHTILLVLPIPQVLMSVPFIMQWTKYVDNPLKDKHFWSLHCWMGFIFILLFFVTLISGIYVYYYMPKKKPFESCEFRAKFTPYHSFMGTVLFIICVLQVITGITSTAQLLTWDTWKAKDDLHTKMFGSRMSSLKVSALLYAFSGMTVIYALYRNDFRYRGRIILTADSRDVN